MGGEPTFVSIDDMDGAEWNTAALGKNKRARAEVLLRRLWQRWAEGGLVHHSQGKWYPGEPLPRWALNCYWREDGRPIWRKPELLADPSQSGSATEASAEKLHRPARPTAGNCLRSCPGRLRRWLVLPVERGRTAGQCGCARQQAQGSRLERDRLRRVFEQGLDKIVGYTLPLGWDPVKESWISNPWKFRRGHMFLLPGDSPMGLRLPLDSLLWEPEAERQSLNPRDPFASGDVIPEEFGEVHARYAAYVEPAPERFGIQEQGAADDHPEDQDFFVRTAICVEPRNGVLHLFLPPLTHLSHWLELISRH